MQLSTRSLFFFNLLIYFFLMTLNFTIRNSTIQYNTLLTILSTCTNNNTIYHLRLITYITKYNTITKLNTNAINFIKHEKE